MGSFAGKHESCESSVLQLDNRKFEVHFLFKKHGKVIVLFQLKFFQIRKIVRQILKL